VSHPRNHPPSRHDRRSHGTGQRVLVVLVVGGITAAIVSLYSREPARHIVPPPTPQAISRMHSTRLQDYAAANAIVHGAQAGDQALAELHREQGVAAARTQTISVQVPGNQSIENPRVRVMAFEMGTSGNPEALPSTTPPAIQLRGLRSVDPHPSRERAMNDALLMARDRLALELRLLDPPIDEVPTLGQIRSQYVQRDSIVEIQPTTEQKAAWSAANLDPDRVWIELDVEVSEDQIRELRSENRFNLGLWVFVGLLIAVASLHSFLRIDTWTKGYLTSTLALSFAAGAGIGIGLLFFVL
jgi:hypothetical protein